MLAGGLFCAVLIYICFGINSDDFDNDKKLGGLLFALLVFAIYPIKRCCGCITAKAYWVCYAGGILTCAILMAYNGYIGMN